MGYLALALIGILILWIVLRTKPGLPPEPPPGYYRLTVWVYDHSTAEPLLGALVTVNTSSQLTNGSGYAYFDLEPGTYDLSVTKEGYGSISAYYLVMTTMAKEVKFGIGPLI